MYDCSVHDERRLKWHSPEGLKEILKRFPLTKEFVDWVAEQGFKVVYDFSWKEGNGAVFDGLRRIMVSPNGSREIIDLTLVHELIHIAAVPGKIFRFTQREYEEYEKVIDEIAKEYMKDSEFMSYVREKIPFSYENQKEA